MQPAAIDLTLDLYTSVYYGGFVTFAQHFYTWPSDLRFDATIHSVRCCHLFQNMNIQNYYIIKEQYNTCIKAH